MSRTSVFLAAMSLAMIHLVAETKSESIDEIIMKSATSSAQFDFFPDGDTDGDVQVELDMLYTKERWMEIMKMRMGKGRSKRKAVRNERFRWPGGVIPYDDIPNTFTGRERNQVMQAIEEWNNYTCINLRPATSSDSNRIRFQDGRGCSSFVGRIPRSSQAVTLAPGCRVKGVIVHEIGHAVGFQHEQTRPDRDRFVTIVEANIPPMVLFNFERGSEREMNDFDVPYDFSSVMHYGSRAFSTNGGLTIVTKDPKFQSVIGNRAGLSFRDIKLANLMYNCAQNCGDMTCPGEGFVGKDCKCYCPGSPIKPCEGSTSGGSTGGGSTGGGSTGGGSTGGENGMCENMNPSCQTWANRGECEANPSYMKVYCRPACNACDDNMETCKDMDRRCGRWAELGFCQGRFEMFMSRQCPLSCDTCPRLLSTCTLGSSAAGNRAVETQGHDSGSSGSANHVATGAIFFVMMTSWGLLP